MLRPGDICRALECEQGETPLSVLHCSTCGSSARLFYGPGNFSEVFARKKFGRWRKHLVHGKRHFGGAREMPSHRHSGASVTAPF